MIWAGLDGPVARAVEEQAEKVLGTYRHEPRRIGQDANIERSIAEGAYAKRQLFELVQNAADAMRLGSGAGRCEVVLTAHSLYVANSGVPFTVEGVIALMATHDSVKRDEQIGRFGLGFKSLLAVTDSPRVISRSGSFAFDRQESLAELSRIVPGLPHYPVMRWARPVDPSDASRGDAVLASLMKWATTVVVAPIKANRDVLARSIAGFPAEFLLFSPHVEQLGLEDRGSGHSRSITLSGEEGGAYVLNDANRRSIWVVRSQKHSPSRSALEDGGYAAARESLEITWAAPLEGAPKGVGTFWAYFPTVSGTTLSGIVNAPWKLADDRESLLAGDFNDELLTQVLPKLVGDALASIHRSDKPTAVLDVLPARGKEARNHADDVLNEPVMKAVSERQCIPTLGGGLRHPTRVRVHPEGLTPDELELWASACKDPDAWATHAIVSTEHRSKVLRLLRYHNRDAVTLKEWVESLVKEPTIEGSAAAVRLVAALLERVQDPEKRPELIRARVLLMDDGTLDACRRGEVFLPGGGNPQGRLIIDPVLAGDSRVVKALNRLGIELFDNAGELRSELTHASIDWHRVWLASRKNSVEEAEAIFRDVLEEDILRRLRVRTYSGKWKAPGEVYLAGPLVPADGSRDPDYLVDPRFHRDDLPLLERLGLVASPKRLRSAPTEAWRTAKLALARDEFRKKVGQPHLRDESIDIDQGAVLWPLGPLAHLSDAGRMALTTAVMKQLVGDERWYVSRAGGASSRKWLPDGTWFHLREHGRLRTDVGIQPVDRSLRRDEAIAVIDDVAQPLPFVDVTISTEQADALGLKADPAELRTDGWAALLDQARGWDEDRRFLAYAWAAYVGQAPPPRIKVRRGPGHVEVAPGEVAITCRVDVFTSLVAAGVPSVIVRSAGDAETLRERWGMADGDELLTETVDFEFAGESYALIDRFPPLRLSLDLSDHDLIAQPCTRLELLTATPGGQQSRPLEQYREGKTVYLTATDDRAVLTQVSRALDSHTIKPDVVLRRMEDQRRSQLRQSIAAAEDVLEKLILAVGIDALRGAIPAAALDGLTHEHTQELSDREIAQLALAVDGYAVLQVHRIALERQGLNPPSQWAGTRNAREWVRTLGLPAEFAGFSGSRREAEMEVEGPPILGELHDYQRAIAEKVKALLYPTATKNRGLLSLPTGAGKTRVAVQALVEHMVDSRKDVRILWLAETDELCEQAIQTWSLVWRAHGPAGVHMTLSRLWASNEPEERDGHQVVVASLAKLDAVVTRNDGNWQETYGWLMHPAMIVVDEAHRSIGPQYTRALSALGGTTRVADMSTPLMGLTATPFRGFNERETEQLARRYSENLLDDGVFPGDDVYGYLQEHRVLARIRHRELQGADLELTEEEVAHVTKMRNLPDSVESRLGKDDARNAEIVRAVLALKPEESALLFATSVENAKVLAALLTYHGVEARAVAGTTDSHARRRYVQDFKDKKVRVLTNYNVFTEGFDVPKVDAVFITRPTFSPNVYQQMIGRGLRGPLNGGKDEVLIVNVADNLTNYGDTFAFRHFEHLWGRGKAV